MFALCQAMATWLDDLPRGKTGGLPGGKLLSCQPRHGTSYPAGRIFQVLRRAEEDAGRRDVLADWGQSFLQTAGAGGDVGMQSADKMVVKY